MTHNTHKRDRRGIIFLAVLLGWLLIILATWGCHPEKKIQREDNKAVQRVLGKYDLQIPIINNWIKSHPQDTSTKVIYIQGEPQIVEKPFRDTAREHQIKDSLIAIGKDCGTAAMDAFNIGYNQAEQYYLKNPKVRVDTKVIERGVSTTEYNRMVDTAGLFAKQLNYQIGRNEQLTQDNKNLNNKNDKLILWLIIVGAGFVLSATFNIRSLISPKKIIDNLK